MHGVIIAFKCILVFFGWVDMCFTAIFLLSFLFVAYPQSPSLRNGTQSKLATCLEVSLIWKCVSKICGIPPKIGGPETIYDVFRWLHNLTSILAGSVFEMKHDIDNCASAFETTRGLLRRLKMSWTVVHKRLVTDVFCYLCFS